MIARSSGRRWLRRRRTILVEARRQVEGFERALVTYFEGLAERPRALLPPEDALLREESQVLASEKRIAVRAAHEETNECLGRVRHREHVARHGTDGPVREATEGEPLDIRAPHERSKRRVRLPGAAKADEQEWLVGKVPLGQRLEETQRELVAPMQVIQNQQDRPVLATRGQDLCQRPNYLEANRFRGQRAEFVRPAIGEGRQRWLVTREDGDGSLQCRARERGMPFAAAVRRHLEHAGEGVEGARMDITSALRAHGDTRARDHVDGLACGLAARLRRQKRLADSAVAFEEDRAAPTVSSTLQRLANALEHVIPAHDGRPVKIGRASDRPFLWALAGRRRERAQDGHDVVGVTYPVTRRLGEESQEKTIDFRGKTVHEACRWRGRLVKMLVKDVPRSAGDEGGSGRERLVEHAAERIQICTRIHRIPSDLFGGDVKGAAHEPPRQVEVVTSGPPEGPRRDSEVHEDWCAVWAQDDVARLEVAMNDSLRVDVRENLAKFAIRLDHVGEPPRCDRQCRRRTVGACRVEIHRSTVAPERVVERREGEPFNEIHGVPGDRVRKSLIEDGDDIRVLHLLQRHNLGAQGGQ